MISARRAAATPRHWRDVETDLVLSDLLHDFAELGELLRGELTRGNWLDAFLLAAGMNQVIDDYMHRDVASFAKVAAHVTTLHRVGTAAAMPLNSIRGLAYSARASLPTERAVAAWQLRLTELVLDLAGCVAAGGESFRPIGLDWRVLLRSARAMPKELQSEVLRLPSCFRSLDLEPRDLERLVAGVTARWPDRNRPLLVVGVRTSGSYLGPLHVAFLRRAGFESVSLITVRPGKELLPGEVRGLRQAVKRDALVVVTDDPPSSGGAVADTASLLEKLGFPTSEIVLSLPLLASAAELPDRLRRLPTVVLDRRDWAIEERLEPEAVQGALNRMLDGRMEVESVSRRKLPTVKDPREDATDRRHVRALFAVRLRREAGERATRLIYVKGTGLGYFGRHSLAVAEAMREHLPEFHGVDGGLLFRDWQPDAVQLSSDSLRVESLAESIAAYTLARSHALAVRRDISARMIGRQAVWQRVADLLAEPFGRLRLLLRPRLHLLARRLLEVESASVVDGSMALRQWRNARGRDGVVKVDYDELAFSNEDIYSYDHVYDLASAAASMRSELGPSAAYALREVYERAAGKRVDEERWFLYQVLSARLSRHSLRANLAHAAADARPHLLDLLDAVESTLEGVQRDYLSAKYLADVASAPIGPLCAIDIDGTLETAPFGFTSIGTAGALALRVLARHGFRAVLASGRSLEEVKERCDSYSLPAGVAEYGAVVYVRARGDVIELLGELDRARLGRLRSVLDRTDGIWLDRRYRHAIRAYRLDSRGRRRGLEPETVGSITVAAGVRNDVVAIPGWNQTDFVTASITKADGLRVAASRLGAVGESLLELAVGDAPADLPMLRLARLGCVPRDASRELHVPGIEVMTGCGQAGLVQAVGRLIGHEPGGCRRCRPPEYGPDAALLLGLMSAYEERGWRRLSRAASVARRVAHR